MDSDVQLIWIVLIGSNQSVCVCSVWFLCLSVRDFLLHLSLPTLSPGKCGRIFRFSASLAAKSWALYQSHTSAPVLEWVVSSTKREKAFWQWLLLIEKSRSSSLVFELG